MQPLCRVLFIGVLALAPVFAGTFPVVSGSDLQCGPDDRSVNEGLWPGDAGGFLFPWDCGATHPCTTGNNELSHTGVDAWAWDFGMNAGTPIRAAKAGTVRVSINRVGPGDACYYGCPSEDYGCCRACLNSFNQVNIAHPDGTTSIYIHLNNATARVGTTVNVDDIIGYSGQSGCAFGAHLHYMVAAGSCAGYCQSIPSSFADNPAVPTRGVSVTKRTCGDPGDGATCPTGPAWAGAGRYCTSSGISGGAPDTLYYCASPGARATVVERCSYGCVPAPPGIDDYCQSGPTCPTGPAWAGAGRYCTSSGISGGQPDTLYYCASAGGPATVVDTCSYGCVPAPPGIDDYCAAQPGPTCPIGSGWYGAGRYCTSSGISGGQDDTLYYCTSAGGPASVVQACDFGCVQAPPGVDDYCASGLR